MVIMAIIMIVLMMILMMVMMMKIMIIPIVIFLKLKFIKHSENLQFNTSLVTGNVQLAICFDAIIKKLIDKNSRKKKWIK